MIKTVELKGFKGITRKFKLEQLNLLIGPNGSGKSAVGEAIIYALTGKVKGDVGSDKAKYLVARYFREGKGSVVVTSDDDVLRRGVTKKGRGYSEIYDSEKEWPYLEEAIDFFEFLSLSADKRRTKILSYFKEDTLNVQEIMETCFERFTYSVTGQQDFEYGALSDKDKKAIEHFTSQGDGIAIQLSSCAIPNISKGYFILRCQDYAKGKKNELAAKIRDLKAVEGGLRSKLERSGKPKFKGPELRKALQEKERLRDNIDKRVIEKKLLAESIDTAQKELESLRRQCKGVESSYEQIKREAAPDPEKPKPLDVSEKSKERERLKHQQEGLSEKLSKINEKEKQIGRLKIELLNAADRKKRLQESPFQKLLDAFNSRPEVLQNFKWEGWGYISLVCESHNNELRVVQREIELQAKERDILGVEIENLKADSPTGDPIQDIAILDHNIAQLTNEIQKSQQAHSMELAKYETAVKEFTEGRNRVESANVNLKIIKREVEKKEGVLKATREKFDRVSSFNGYEARLESEKLRNDIEALRETLGENVQLVQLQEEIEEAQKNIADAAIEESAWSHTLIALKVIRDSFVESKSRAFVNKANELLEASGLNERLYIIFEDEKGKPIFEMGLHVGDYRVAFSALSSGQRLLMSIALSCAFYYFAKTIKLVALEADSLDPEVLPKILGGVTKISKDFLDVVLISTCHKIKPPTGWQVIQF